MDIIEGYIDYIKDKKNYQRIQWHHTLWYKKNNMEYINQKSIKLVDIVENDIISYLIKLEKIMYQ